MSDLFGDANNFLENGHKVLHIMVDIETLDTSVDSAITEIGAVIIAGGEGNKLDRAFYYPCIDPRGSVSKETIEWRNKNNLPRLLWDQTIPEEELEMNPLHIKRVMRNFFEWIEDVCKTTGATPVMWCKGTDFDKVILTRAAKNRCGIEKTPWAYNKFFDVRTLLYVFPQFKIPSALVKHNGFDDALAQASCLTKIAEHISELRALEQSME
jgi:3' exoribonuclease, RNase T-like